jgi:hypothetical protein
MTLSSRRHLLTRTSLGILCGWWISASWIDRQFRSQHGTEWCLQDQEGIGDAGTFCALRRNCEFFHTMWTVEVDTPMYMQCNMPQYCDIFNMSAFTSTLTVFFWTASTSSGPMGCSSATGEGRWRLQGASAIGIPTLSIGGVLPRSGQCPAYREEDICFVLASREHRLGVALL